VTEIGFPFRIGGDGRTAGAGPAAHARELIEQVLFTAPGERANRPDFGSGLLQLVFAGGGDEATAAAAEFAIRGALQQWLGDRIAIDGLSVVSEAATLSVTVRYAVISSGERRTDTFTREL
jgi:uncharacterized protein